MVIPYLVNNKLSKNVYHYILHHQLAWIVPQQGVDPLSSPVPALHPNFKLKHKNIKINTLTLEILPIAFDASFSTYDSGTLGNASKSSTVLDKVFFLCLKDIFAALYCYLPILESDKWKINVLFVVITQKQTTLTEVS